MDPTNVRNPRLQPSPASITGYQSTPAAPLNDPSQALDEAESVSESEDSDDNYHGGDFPGYEFGFRPGDEYSNSGQTGQPTYAPIAPGPNPNPQAQGPKAPQPDPKKQRACNGCRRQKVRCDRDPRAPKTAPCLRCKKAGRQCITTPSTRKRRKKVDTEEKFAAIEEELKELRDLRNQNMALRAQQKQTAEASNRTPSMKIPSWRVTENAERPVDTQKRKRSENSDTDDEEMRDYLRPPPTNPDKEPDPDIIDRGLMTMEQAETTFARYRDGMTRHFPAVVFPDDATVWAVRRAKPVLFLAVMAAASFELPEIQRVVTQELSSTLAQKIFIDGKKSLELVQALHVGVIWYYPPDHFEELKFYQFVHIAAVMALDIGLGKFNSNAKSRLIPYTWKDHPMRHNPLPDPTSIEARRTWLSCYFLASNVAMALHRPNLIRWTPFMDDCMETLRTAEDAAPSDSHLCNLVWTHKLAMDVGEQFSMDDPSSFVNIAEPKVQYALRGFVNDLEKFRKGIREEENHPSLTLIIHVIALYMHEIAIYVDKTDEPAPPFNTDALRDPVPGLRDSLTHGHIEALGKCLAAINGLFDTFLDMDIDSIRCLPVYNFVRVAYAVVVLLKLHFSSTAPGSELGKVIDRDNIKADVYMDRLMDKFYQAAADDKSRPASKFLIVLLMLCSWFKKQGGDTTNMTNIRKIQALQEKGKDKAADGYPPDNNDQGPPQSSSSQQNPAPPEQPPPPQGSDPQPAASTPLHVLSELAIGGGAPRHASNSPSTGMTPSSHGIEGPQLQGQHRQGFQGWPPASQPMPQTQTQAQQTRPQQGYDMGYGAPTYYTGAAGGYQTLQQQPQQALGPQAQVGQSWTQQPANFGGDMMGNHGNGNNNMNEPLMMNMPAAYGGAGGPSGSNDDNNNNALPGGDGWLAMGVDTFLGDMMGGMPGGTGGFFPFQ